MKKFVDHIDDRAWICMLANIEYHVAELERVLDINLEHFGRSEMGVVDYCSTAACIEVVAPLAEIS